MKSFLKIIIVVCAFCLTGNAQVYFNNIYPYGTLVANASSVIEIDTGGYLFPSCTFGSYSSLLINRINQNGDTLFTKEYIKSSCSFGTGASNSIIETVDNNYVFSGSILDGTSNRDALLVKLTENGDTLWTKTYGGANFDNANVVCQTSDSGFVLMGVTQSFSMGAASDFYLIKTDSLGNFQWQQTYGTTLAEDCVSGQITLDGGYILSGHRNNQLHIVKTNSNGLFQWEKVYSGTAGQGFIKQLSDSTYILVGTKSISGLAYQAYMAKLTKTGIVIWEKTFGGAGDQQFYAIPIILNDGSIVCSGVSNAGIVQGLLVKTDSLGNQQWLRTYDDPNSAFNDYFYDARQTLDGGFIMSGYSTNGWLVKVDSAGCEIANCNVGVEDIQISNFRLKIYPNPATSEINFSIEGEDLNKYELSIVNVLGEVQKIEINQSVISISELSSGIYFITATSKEGQKRLSQKFIKD